MLFGLFCKVNYLLIPSCWCKVEVKHYIFVVLELPLRKEEKK